MKTWTSFNSLYEILTLTVSSLRASTEYVTFNSLYEIHVLHKFLLMVKEGTFNSLYEIQKADGKRL